MLGGPLALLRIQPANLRLLVFTGKNLALQVHKGLPPLYLWKSKWDLVLVKSKWYTPKTSAVYSEQLSPSSLVLWKVIPSKMFLVFFCVGFPPSFSKAVLMSFLTSLTHITDWFGDDFEDLIMSPVIASFPQSPEELLKMSLRLPFSENGGHVPWRSCKRCAQDDLS